MPEVACAGVLNVVNETGIKVQLQYCGNIPVMGLKEKLQEEWPQVQLEKKGFFKGNLQILDETATLSQLGIKPGDTLLVKKVEEEAQDIIVSEAESTTMRQNFPAEGVTLKDPMNNRNLKNCIKKSAHELWRTSLPMPPTTKLISHEVIEASSLSNITHGSLQALNSSLQLGFIQPRENTLNEYSCFNTILNP